MFSRQRGHSGIFLEAVNYKREVSRARTTYVTHELLLWRLQCATFATCSTVHHKLDSTSKPSLSLLSAPPHVLPPMPSLCLPFLKSLLPHRQGHLEEDVAESEVGGLSSEDEGQSEVGVASSKAI